MENKNVTIVDLFIDILSKNKDTQSQNMVKRLKVFIRIPECAEFLNVVIINAMGYKSQIKSTTVDKAVECIINQSNIRVDEDNSLDEHQKQQIKKDNEIILRMCTDITTPYGARRFPPYHRLNGWGCFSPQNSLPW